MNKRRRPGGLLLVLAGVMACCSLLAAGGGGDASGRSGSGSVVSPAIPQAPALDPSPPAQPVRLIFIHHSTGEAWLNDAYGQLGLALRSNNYFVSDTNYGWGPADLDEGYDTIGDHTDIPNWYSWFTGPHRETYLAALYAEGAPHSSYSRLAANPGGSNVVVMFKSCFPNSNLSGSPTDPPAASATNFSSLTVANAKRIYLDLLPYFAAHQEKLFVAIAAPPLRSEETTAENAANARAFNNWLVADWLAGYPHSNVAVFDFYTVLSSNAGNASTNDLGSAAGNHHRYRAGAIEHITDQATNYLAYPTGDSHPSQAGDLKATGELVPLLNVFYHRWRDSTPAPTVAGVVPSGGSVQGGTRLTVTGTNFVGGATVTIGGQPATSIVVTSATTIAATTPAHAAAAADVVVTNPDAQSGSLAGGFTYLALPAFTDDPLLPGVTTVRAAHVMELRQRITEVRARYGLGTVSWTDPPLVQGATLVRVAHVYELRVALDAVYAAAGRPAPVYTDHFLWIGLTVVKAVHMAELRSALLAIW